MSVRKLLLLISLVLLPLPVFPMNDNEEKTMVTEKCAMDLKSIDNDGAAIYAFCDGVFSEMSDQTQADPSKKGSKPSDLLKCFFSNGIAEEAIEPKFMTAQLYFSRIGDPKIQELDSVFLAKCKELKDEPAAWKWLKGYFKEHILVNCFVELKKERVANDQEFIRLAKKGIFFHGSTVIIDPSRAEKYKQS